MTFLSTKQITTFLNIKGYFYKNNDSKMLYRLKK